MAFENKFAYNDFTSIRRLDAQGMRPAYAVGPAHLWQKKGSKELYCTYKDGSFSYRYDNKNDADKMLAKQRHGLGFRASYAKGLVTFESYELKSLILDFFGIK